MLRWNFLLFVILFCGLTILVELASGRPHIRHHRGGSHCSRCSPGSGAVVPCTRGRDTRCSECSPGTYSPHHSTQPCWICSRCGPGLYEAHPCTTLTDTVCDSCHRHAPENPDYRSKCHGRGSFFLAPEDALNTGEESSLVNEYPENSRDLRKKEEEDEILRQDAQAEMKDGRNSLGDVSEEADSVEKL
ncbi:uncharacterized protein [Prorops nasuta]|uniref:uncharacterized protein n=1 Tax=Prorops nasuta TaxID=863751 RepID=UPI0034CD3D69